MCKADAGVTIEEVNIDSIWIESNG